MFAVLVFGRHNDPVGANAGSDETSHTHSPDQERGDSDGIIPRNSVLAASKLAPPSRETSSPLARQTLDRRLA